MIMLKEIPFMNSYERSEIMPYHEGRSMKVNYLWRHMGNISCIISKIYVEILSLSAAGLSVVEAAQIVRIASRTTTNLK
jgi:hypothetical protein